MSHQEIEAPFCGLAITARLAFELRNQAVPAIFCPGRKQIFLDLSDPLHQTFTSRSVLVIVRAVDVPRHGHLPCEVLHQAVAFLFLPSTPYEQQAFQHKILCPSELFGI